MSEPDNSDSSSQLQSTDDDVINPDPASPPPLLQDIDDATDPNDLDDNDGPPAKRRKLAPQKREDPNPWNLPKADGPTSFLEGGRRKSGRTNVIPLELQPQKKGRQTRAAYDKEVEDRSKHTQRQYNGRRSQNLNHVDAHTRKPSTTTSMHRGPGRPQRQPHQTQPNKFKMEKASSKHAKSLSRGQIGNFLGNQKKDSKQLVNGHTRTVPGTSNRKNHEQQTNGHISDITSDSSEDDQSDSAPSDHSPGPPSALKKIRFKVFLPKPSIQSPLNMPLQKRFSSFEDYLDKDESEPRAGQDMLSPTQITREAMARQKIMDARVPGSKLEEVLARPAAQQEPKQYAHYDHVLAHVRNFRNLLFGERARHIKQAKAIALEAKSRKEARDAKNRVKTDQELEEEARVAIRTKYRIVSKDLEKLWAAVQMEVDLQRQRLWENEQRVRLDQQLNEELDKSKKLLEHKSVDLETEEDNESGSESEDASESENSENMSNEDSGSDSEKEDDDMDLDANMSPEALRKKYEHLPVALPESETEDNDDYETSRQESEQQPSLAPHTDADTDNIEDDSDPSTEMDSEMDSEVDNDGDTETGEGDSDEDEDDDASRPSLLGLYYSKREIADMGPEPEENDSEMADVTDNENDASASEPIQKSETDTPLETDAENSIAEAGDSVARREISPRGGVAHDIFNDPTSQEASTHPSPHTSSTRAETESTSSLEHQAETHPTPVVEEPMSASTNKTRIPALLRATLRPYQHDGLDWLADVYATGRSGILADEMGLGKTIQSITLLAHLAEEYGVWGPHLIVVPTSVILNWEMEFKKFCPGFKVLTYYGNQDERRQKRKGWMAEDAFNVCITSYQLVLQDANTFKRRQWHCLILDEAHNIKNFKSDRWQTMLKFNTHMRLLLTGTPLQNNIGELWSLVYFLRSGARRRDDDDNNNDDDDDQGFASLTEFGEWFNKPTGTILEHGRDALSEEQKKQVNKLHTIIRPFLLRRLKKDVEKQMPLKYEHVELCRLSKRQRQLYDGFMSRTKTKETLASGNYLSIINALMQLRKVCNHPDLFETRPITTSFAMPKSVAAGFEIRDLLVRRKMVQHASESLNLDFLNLAPISREHMSMIEFRDTRLLLPGRPLEALRNIQWRRMKDATPFEGNSLTSVMSSLENIGRDLLFKALGKTLNIDSYRHHGRPFLGKRLLQQLKINTKYETLSRLSGTRVMTKSWESEKPVDPLNLVQSIQTRSAMMEPLIEKFACITPTVTASDLTTTALTKKGVELVRESQAQWLSDPFHEARMKLSIAFPDKRLLQYDCGKLQRLDKLLKELQIGGHRALIFTQMTKVLDILEQFLNIHGHRYLRLDGSTKIEQRQILTDRFNNDNRILAFILSSRSGGLGINLTGADTVIFYDLDWNPAMDKQCTDRAHRIGQTRDVHIYRFVSEHTIESNILRKATQKQMLDDVVIQEGDFTTDYISKLSYRDMLPHQTEIEDEVGAVMDKILGNDDNHAAAALEQAEDREDATAAKAAEKEVQHSTATDFNFDSAVAAPLPQEVIKAAIAEAEAEVDNSAGIDEWMVKFRQWEMKDVPLAPQKDKSKKRKRKGDEHRVRKPR